MKRDHYPHLYDVASEQAYPLSGLPSAAVGTGDQANISLTDCRARGILFRLRHDGRRWFVEPSAGHAISLNQLTIDDPVPLPHLAIIQVAHRLFVFVEREDPAAATSYAMRAWLVGQVRDVDESFRLPEFTNNLGTGETLRLPIGGIRELMEPLVPLELPGEVPVREARMLIGRDPQRNDICLPDVRVSRVHASIVRQGSTTTITDLKSTNHTFVGGQPIRKPTILHEGSRIRIGSYTLVYRRQSLYPLSHDNNVELVGLHLVRHVPDRKHRGQPKVILDDVSLVVRPREFVCILGPSGSGKTTLLSALSARIPADGGTVLLNGENLYTQFEALKQNLAVVPQRDLLHDTLPLKTALWYTAKMRLPADLSARDIDERIDATLETVNLVQRQFTRIRQLSGGQIKRASWANQAISNPSLIFLDEVTSGLDEQTDSEMMQMFRHMADQGKTIVCVTHSLSYVEQNCHLLAILAEGGVLAFYGSPAEALEYFEVSRLGDVYQRLKQHSPTEWKERYQASSFYHEYVQSRLPVVSQDEQASKPPWRARELLTGWRQFHLLLRRYFSIQCADLRSLAMIFGQSLVIAGLLVWLFGNLSKLNVDDEVAMREEQLYELQYGGSLAALSDEDKQFLEQDEQYVQERDKQRRELTKQAELAKRTDLSSKLLFLMCISCLWFGCNNAAKEIVKEAAIYARERDVGLKVWSYYASKLVLLGILSVLQVTLFYAIVRSFTHLGGNLYEQWLLLAFSAVTGVALGLAISAISHTEDLAVTIVPMVLIPQIILAGLIAPLLNYTREFSQVFIPAYWSFQGLLMTMESPVQERLRDSAYLNLDTDWTPASVAVVLLIYMGVFASVAWVALRFRD